MKIGQYFDIEELTHSDTADKLGIYNIPTSEQIANLVHLVEEVLDPLRRKIGRIKIDSGFRSQQLNDAIPGSSKTSQHMEGKAADIVPMDTSLERAFSELRLMKFDQLIWEETWIHVSWNGFHNRGEVLEIYKDLHGNTHYKPYEA